MRKQSRKLSVSAAILYVVLYCFSLTALAEESTVDSTESHFDSIILKIDQLETETLDCILDSSAEIGLLNTYEDYEECAEECFEERIQCVNNGTPVALCLCVFNDCMHQCDPGHPACN